MLVDCNFMRRDTQRGAGPGRGDRVNRRSAGDPSCTRQHSVTERRAQGTEADEQSNKYNTLIYRDGDDAVTGSNALKAGAPNRSPAIISCCLSVAGHCPAEKLPPSPQARPLTAVELLCFTARKSWAGPVQVGLTICAVYGETGTGAPLRQLRPMIITDDGRMCTMSMAYLRRSRQHNCFDQERNHLPTQEPRSLFIFKMPCSRQFAKLTTRNSYPGPKPPAPRSRPARRQRVATLQVKGSTMTNNRIRTAIAVSFATLVLTGTVLAANVPPFRQCDARSARACQLTVVPRIL